MSQQSKQSTPKNKLGRPLSSQSSSVNLRVSFRENLKKKPNKMILAKRGLHKIFDNHGINRTPKLLQVSDFAVIEKWQPTVLDYVDAFLASSGSQISISNISYLASHPASSHTLGSWQQQQQKLQQQQQKQQQQSQSISLHMSFSNIANVESYKDLTKTLDGEIASDSKSLDRFLESAPSAFYLKIPPSREFYPPNYKVPLVARETDSFTLFSMNSVVLASTAENIDSVKADNEFYEYITVGKGKYTRRLTSSEQQTPIHISISEVSYCPRMGTKNGACWITDWKLFDEYFGCVDKRRNFLGYTPEDQWAMLKTNDRFLILSIIMDRILGASTFREIQLTYKTLRSIDPMDLDVTFSYSLETLWIFKTPQTQNKSVMAVAINKLFSDIIAVGYGKFLYKESDKGFVCIWSVKNPKNPERFYKFTSSVTCLGFAEWTPNTLAVGFLNGDLYVLDISYVEKKIIFIKDSFVCDTFESILFAEWWIYINLFGKEDERLMITTKDGRIIQLRRKLDRLIPFQMMRTTKTEGKLKGIDYLPNHEAEEIAMNRFPAARAAIRYPNDGQYYLVPGDDGIIHKCSVNFFAHHIDSFLAHSGPIYALKFSPFCNKIFLTCGADGAIRLWVWDIFEPVIMLSLGPAPIEDADWSPRNSTIIASICEAELHLWDLKRKIRCPSCIFTHPDKIKYSTVQFTEAGNNILLGDVEGSLFIMSLYGMPFEETYKEDILVESIVQKLALKPRLLKILGRSGPPFSHFI